MTRWSVATAAEIIADVRAMRERLHVCTDTEQLEGGDEHTCILLPAHLGKHRCVCERWWST